jgi:hypothetical protein
MTSLPLDVGHYHFLLGKYETEPAASIDKTRDGEHFA